MKEKFSNFFKWFANLGNIVKTIIGLITFGGLVLGGVRAYNNKVIKSYQKVQKEQKEQVRDSILFANIDSLMLGQKVLKSNVSYLITAIDKNTKEVKALKSSHVSLLKETGKIDLLLQYYESRQEMLKKNENYLNEIALPNNNSIWTPLVYKLDHE